MQTDRSVGVTTNAPSIWVWYVILVLIFEKIIQHITVTVALAVNWRDIRSTVVVSPDILMVLGALVAVGFVVSLWGMVTKQRRAVTLVIALALFDIIGEFVAQGRISIVITVSFLVAVVLLILAIVYRRQSWKSS